MHRRTPERFPPSAAWLTAALLLWAALQPLATRAQDASAAEERPNILFALADDVSFPHMGPLSPEWIETPHVTRVARDGLLFNRAYAPNNKCAPSRAAILTGRNSWQLGAAANHWAYWPDRFASYVEALGAHGYHTGHTGKGWAPGIAKKENGDPRYLAGVPFEERTTDPPTDAMSEIDYAANFRAFLDDASDEQPFAFWYGAYEPHRGYEYGSGIRKGGKRRDAIEQVLPFWPDTDSVRTDLLDYAFEIEYFDRQLGRMIDLLRQRGELDNTLVVVTADNGMPFPRVKGQTYERAAHLPLAMRWGNGIEHPGRVIEDHVSLIDLAPTFLEVAGVNRENTRMKPVTGRSLAGIFNAETEGQVNPDRNRVLVGKEHHDVGRPDDAGYPARGIITDDYFYVRNFKPDRWPAGPPQTGYLNVDGSPTKTAVLDARTDPDGARRFWEWSFGKRPPEELYRIASDPANVDNLADEPMYRGLKKRLRKRLVSQLEKQGDPRIMGDGDVFEEYRVGGAWQRNFYERYLRGDLEKSDAGWVNPSDFEPNFSPPDSSAGPPTPNSN
jgi:arylsulfatase A-like enzyme